MQQLQYQMALPFQMQGDSWRPPVVSKLPSWAGAKRVGLDIETWDPKLKQLGPGVRRGAKIVGISFAIEDGPSAYLPIGHTENNLDKTHVMNYITDQCKEYDGDIVGANLAYDLDFLWEAGVHMPKVKKYRDIQVAEPLIDDLQDRYAMELIAQRRGLPGKDERLLRDAAKLAGVDPKKGLWQLPARFVGAYAEQDARLPLTILRRQERDIEEQDLWQIYDLETRLLPVLVRMRRRGVRVDFAHLRKVEDWTIQEQAKEIKKIFELSGVRLGMEDFNKSEAVAMPLKAIGVTNFNYTKAKSPKISIDKFFLAGLKHPVADAILRARKVDKLRNTFCASVREHEVNGKIHTTFNQLRRSTDSGDENEDDQGARYGRLSSCDPNLQQQPARDPEIGKFWRCIYIPEDGMQWAAMDYSQQEPRMVVHYGVIAGCAGADKMAHAFNTDPEADNHTMMAKLCWDEATLATGFKRYRGYAKEIFLGICYGMGGAKLAKKLGLPTKWIESKRLQKMIEVAGAEAQEIMDNVDKKLPYVRLLAKMCEDRAKSKGRIRTLLGRVCRFPFKFDYATKTKTTEYDWCHKALNRLIQGSSGDQTKMALVTMDEMGETPQLQVHDEIDTSVRDEAHAETLADVMRHCVPLKVPSKVDVELGKSWGDSM